MTKKKFLAVFVAAILALTCVCVALVGWGGGADDNKLTSIDIDYSTVKTDYVAGQTLDLTGLTVTAIFGTGDKAKREPVTDYTTTPEAGAKLSVSDKSVKVLYEKDGVTKSKSFSIKVHNDITGATVKTQPTKTTYMPGETFSVAGMSFDVTYEDGTTDVVEATADNTTVSPSKITADTTSVTVTFAGKEFTVDVELANGVFIEAEDGILPEGSKLCTDGLTSDETHKPSGTGYVGDFKADNSKDLRMTFVFDSDKAGKGDIAFRMASQYLKQDSGWVPIWMGDTQLNKICDVYVNGTQVSVADDAILEGGGEQDGQSSMDLWLNWKTVELNNVSIVAGTNEVQLKFKEHDYTDCSQGDFNGKFTANIDSLIVTSADCKISEHELDFDANSVTITGAELKNEEGVPYFVINGTAKFTGYTDEQAADTLNKHMNQNSTSNVNQFTFSGFDFDFQGNLEESTNGRFLNTAADREVVMTSVADTSEGAGKTDRIGTFAIKVDVSSLATNADGKGKYSTHFGVNTTNTNFNFITEEEAATGQKDSYSTDKVSTQKITAGYNEYSLTYEPWYDSNKGDKTYNGDPAQCKEHCYGTVGLIIENKASIGEYSATSVTVAQGDTYGELTVSGNLSWSLYSNDDIEDAFASLMNISLNKDGTDFLNGASDRVVTVQPSGEGTGTFTAKLNIYSLAAGDYTLKLNGADVKVAVSTDKVSCGSRGYTLSGSADAAVALKVEINGTAPTLASNPISADIEVIDGKLYLIYNSTYEGGDGYAEAEIKSIIAGRYADVESNGSIAGVGGYVKTTITVNVDDVTLGTGEEGVKTFTVKFVLPTSEMTKSAYTVHYAGTNSGNDYKPSTNANNDKSVTLNGKKYTLKVVPGSSDGADFWGCPGIVISDAEA